MKTSQCNVCDDVDTCGLACTCMCVDVCEADVCGVLHKDVEESLVLVEAEVANNVRMRQRLQRLELLRLERAELFA